MAGLLGSSYLDSYWHVSYGQEVFNIAPNLTPPKDIPNASVVHFTDNSRVISEFTGHAFYQGSSEKGGHYVCVAPISDITNINDLVDTNSTNNTIITKPRTYYFAVAYSCCNSNRGKRNITCEGWNDIINRAGITIKNDFKIPDAVNDSITHYHLRSGDKDEHGSTVFVQWSDDPALEQKRRWRSAWFIVSFCQVWS